MEGVGVVVVASFWRGCGRNGVMPRIAVAVGHGLVDRFTAGEGLRRGTYLFIATRGLDGRFFDI